MADSKYGRIYTEADVVRLLRVVNESRDSRSGASGQEIVDEWNASTTFPADEPVFVLRGKDELAPRAMLGYALEAESRSLWLVAGGVWAARARVVAWQLDNPSLVKRPD